MYSKIITRSDISSVEQLRKVMNELSTEFKGFPLYVMMSAAVNPSTGKLWCPDCVAAMETLIPKIETAPENKKIAMLIVPLEREVYKSSQPIHPFKADTDLQLTAIPTIYHYNTITKHFEKGLVEADVYNPTKFLRYFGFDV